MSDNMITGPLAGQFERHGDGWVYRQDGRGPALPLSAEEKDRFIGAYGWRMALALVGFMAGMIALSIVLYQLFGKSGIVGPVLMALFMLGLLYLTVRWVAHAPSRALAGRTPVAPPRSKEEVIARAKVQRTPGGVAMTGAGFLVAAVLILPESTAGALAGVALGVAILVWALILKIRATN